MPGNSSIRIWFEAARPRTLGAAFAPVIIGTAMAYGEHAFHWPSAVCALAGALLIQIGTNFANDYFDFVKGADTAERKGPRRATHAGLVTPAAMRRAAITTYAAALIPGAYIIRHGGWPFAVIGVLAILFGVLYTGGPYPLGYLGLGDVFVFIFFGPVAVGGTYYLQAQTLTAAALIAGLAPGLLSVALLSVNNLRDINEDRQAGKRTLAVRFGVGFARAQYVASTVLACVAVPLYFATSTGVWLFALAPLSMVVPARKSLVAALMSPPGPGLNKLLAATGRLLLVFSVLFSLGWVACR